MKKPAIFMDAFLTDEGRHEIFNYNVSQFIKHGWDVFVISNKIGHFGSFSGIKYFEYDSTNRILADKTRYELISRLVTHSHVGSLDGSEYMFRADTPTHGFTNWTLLYNMRRMALAAKLFGHTHFITCEYDIRFKNYNLMDTIFKGFGDTEKSKTCMVIPHGGFGCLTNLYLINVDFVLSRIPDMPTEDDYEQFLRSLYGSPRSPVFEQLFWEKLVEYDSTTETGKNAEFIPDSVFFDNLEEWGVFISDGDLGLRQTIFYKSLLVSPANNNTVFFIRHEKYDTPVLVEYVTDQETKQFTINPQHWITIPCEGRQYIKIRTSESVKHTTNYITFDLSKQCDATFTRIK